MSPRKPLGGSLREVVEVIDHRALEFDKPEPGSEAKRGQPGAKRYKDKRYVFDQVMGMDASQEHVYDRTTRPLLDGILDGYNATVFAYGATGCGKTHTISGSVEDPGIIIRTMEDLFKRIDDSKDDFETEIELSFVEIYNETIRDLLNDEPPKDTRGLKLLENEKERVTIADVKLMKPESVDQVMELVQKGNGRRTTHFTESNSVSSRSHAVLQINVGRYNRSHEVDMSAGIVRQFASSATLSIIDLAGSERASATRNMGARMKEGANINKSLLALSSCISSLCQRPAAGLRRHIPYRDSKLTRLLKFSLGGNCRTVMVVCVSPSSKDIEDTFNTLTWANQAKNVTTKVTRNTAGNRVNVAQYLSAIQEKESMIKVLQARLSESEKRSFHNPKVEEEMKRAKTELERLQLDIAAAIPTLVEGAEKRVMWDGAELRVSSYKRCIDEIARDASLSEEAAARRKAFFIRLVSEQDRLYRQNAALLAAMGDQSTKDAALASSLTRFESKSFPALGPLEKENLSLGIANRRLEMAASAAAAREKTYRQAIMQQAETLSRAALEFCNVRDAIQAEAKTVSGEQETELAKRLVDLIEASEASLSKIFDCPFPSIIPSSTVPSAAPPRRLPRASLTTRTSVPPSPATRKVKHLASALKSPAKFARTPRKGALRSRTSTTKENSTAKKGLRWRDQAGEGSLEASKTFKVATSSESSANDFSISSEDSNWQDEPDEQPPLPAGPLFAMKPTRAIFPPKPPRLPSTSTSMVPTASRPTSPSGDNVPEWKKNRMLMSKVGGLSGVFGELPTLAEGVESSPTTGSSTSSYSPISGPTRPSRMGPPARSGLSGDTSRALSELRQIPGETSTMPSSLFRPTTASAAKSINSSFAGPSSASATAGDGGAKRRSSLLPSSATSGPSSSRGLRESMGGPTRNIRQKTRMSLLPYGSSGPNASVSINSNMSMSSQAPGALSALSGGAQRAKPEGLPVVRRMSSMGTLGLPRGPESGSGLPGLSHRPSMGRLNVGIGNLSIAGMAGGGEGRPAWR